jgi:hypothetical protein
MSVDRSEKHEVNIFSGLAGVSLIGWKKKKSGLAIGLYYENAVWKYSGR